MLYRLMKVTDLNGKDKTDEKSAARVGRIIDLDVADVKVGRFCFMECVVPGWDKSVITSNVQECIEAEDGMIIKTENSYYYLVEEDKANKSPYEN